MRDLVKSLLFFALILCGANAYAHDNYCHRWHICPSDTGSYVCGDMGMCDQCPDNEYCQDKKPRKGTVSQEKKKIGSSIRDLEPPPLSKKKSNEPDEPTQSSTPANVNSDKTEKPLTLEDLTVERIPALTKSPKIKVSSKPATKSRSFNAKELFKEARDSVVLIMSFDANNQPMGIGSGFFVNAGEAIATNYHVVEGANLLQIKLTNGQVARINTALGLDLEHDLILLKSPLTGHPLPLTYSTPEIGEDIIAIGNPKGLTGTLSLGIVSGIRQDKNSLYYQITAPISPGSSGGPIINSKGEVIGVSTFYVQGGQNLNFAMPSAYINKMLRKLNPVSIRSIIKHKKQNKKKDYIAGNVRITEPDCRYPNISASALNLNSTPIKNIRGIAIFYPSYFNRQTRKMEQKSKYPVHYKLFSVKETVPSKLALRFSIWDRKIKCKWIVKIRILDYDLIQDNSEIISIPTFE